MRRAFDEAEPGDCEQYWDCRRRRPVLGGFWSTAETSPANRSTTTLSTSPMPAPPRRPPRRAACVTIATASGYTVDSVHVTSSGNLSSLRDALTECGFDDVVSVPLTEATRAWARDRAANVMEKTAICILGQDSAALSVIDTRKRRDHDHDHARRSSPSYRLAEHRFRRRRFAPGSAVPDWISFRARRRRRPSRQRLCVPVVATHDAQLALGPRCGLLELSALHLRGRRTRVRVRRRMRGRSTAVAAVAVASVFALSACGQPITLARAWLRNCGTPARRAHRDPAAACPSRRWSFRPRCSA